MAIKFLIDLLTGNLVLVQIPTPAVTSGTAFYADKATGINFINANSMNWIT